MIKTILKGLSQRPVSYYKVYREIAGSTVAGIMLSQLVYWFTATGKDTIFKIDEDWVEELDLSDGEIKGGKAKLKQLDFLEIFMKGTPAKTHYKIDWELLAEAIEVATIDMEAKRVEREQKKAEKALERANKSQDSTVRRKVPNKVGEGDKGCSADRAEQVRRKVPNKVGEIDPTLYKAENTEESTTERNSENLHSRCDVSIEKGKEHDENLRYRYDISIEKVVEHMNAKFKTNYKITNKHVKSILKQGFTVEEMITVIDKKYADWFNTDQEQYLRPSTLFGDKFEEYLNAKSKEQRLKSEKFAKILFKKFEGAVKLIEQRGLQIEDLLKLKSNFNPVFSQLEVDVLNNYNSMKLLLSLFMQGELELSLKEKCVHVLCP